MTAGSPTAPAPNVLTYLSTAGSSASLVGLVIVLLQLFVPHDGRSSQLVAWQFILCLIALIATGGMAVYIYACCLAVVESQRSSQRKTIIITLTVISGLIGIGVAIDGFFAALLWVPWLRIVGQLVRYALS
jgi:ABC-type Na+ efflux pump permease subunit